MFHKHQSGRRALACVLLAVLMATGVAVARDKKDHPRIKGTLVDVTLTEYAIQMPSTLKHGWVTFRITNNGTVPHGVCAQDGRKTYQPTSQIAPGASVLSPIKLKKGSFMLYCSIKAHADAGMQAVAYVE
jgi:uncharacterized cupredoxin-like copper-binding protein